MSQPYATLLGFTRYVGRTGPGKATFVGGLRRQRESRSGFNPHGQLVKALKADIQFCTGGSNLEAVVETVHPRWQPLYRCLAPGATRYLHSLGTPPAPSLFRTGSAMDTIGGLTIRINPHFGLEYPDGSTEAVRLFFDEQAPSPEVLAATLHLMGRCMDQVRPGATAVVVDVRRGNVSRAPAATHDGPTNQDSATERWLTGEAAAFSAMWTAAA